MLSHLTVYLDQIVSFLIKEYGSDDMLTNGRVIVAATAVPYPEGFVDV